ncbi:MAG: hypothetical protein AAGM38_11935 [Pseudomonadota bacterium]
MTSWSLSRPALERPNAAAVIGVVILAANSALLGIAALGGFSLESVATGDLIDWDGEALRDLGPLILMVLSVAAAVGLLRSSRFGSGAAILVAVLLPCFSVMAALGWPAIATLTYCSTTALIALLTSRGRPSGQSLSLARTAALTAFLVAAGVVMGLALREMAQSSHLGVAATSETAVRVLIIPGALCALGAAIVRFRWGRAVIGWPLIAASSILVYAAVEALADSARPASAPAGRPMAPGAPLGHRDILVVPNDPPAPFAPDPHLFAAMSAASLLTIGVLLLRAQARMEAAARVETLETTFR